jgi:hypothetical protein
MRKNEPYCAASKTCRSGNSNSTVESAGPFRSVGATISTAGPHHDGGHARVHRLASRPCRDVRRQCARQLPEGSCHRICIGRGIGWHRDRSVFGDVVGVSPLPSCTFRLRKRTLKGFERQSLVAEPRSVYLLRGASRTEWEHSIPGVECLRYSITFRNVLERSES